MRISQYVYFSISSETVPAATVAAHLGMGADEFLVWEQSEQRRRFRYFTLGRFVCVSEA
jgi:hypothetical protein